MTDDHPRSSSSSIEALNRSLRVPDRPPGDVVAPLRTRREADITQLDALDRRVADARAANASDLRKLTGDAVLAQYEAAAQAVESMGNDIKQRIAKLTSALEECNDELKSLGETAQAIRERGKHTQAMIDETSAMLDGMRSVCADFRKKAQLS